VDCQFLEEEAVDSSLVSKSAGDLIFDNNNENIFGVDNSLNNLVAFDGEDQFPDSFVHVDEAAADLHVDEVPLQHPLKRTRRTEDPTIIKGKKGNNTSKTSAVLKKLAGNKMQSPLPSFLMSTQVPSLTPPQPSIEDNTPCSSGVLISQSSLPNLSSLTQTTCSIGNNSSTQRSSNRDNESSPADDNEMSTTEEKKVRAKKSVVWRVCQLDNSKPDDVRLKCICGWNIRYSSGTSGALEHIKKCDKAVKHLARIGDKVVGNLSSPAVQIGANAVIDLTPPSVDSNQTLLSYLPDGTLSAKHRNRDYANVNLKRGRLSEFILLDKEPFKKADHIGFRRFVATLQPLWTMPGSQTVTNDIQLTVFPELKRCIKEGLLVDTDSDTAYSLTTDIYNFG
jgi:hypothetical protein